MRKFLLASMVLTVVSVGILSILFLNRSRSVLLRIPPDSTVRPRYYCLLNPFREKGPETVAASYLNRLRTGEVQSISCCIGEKEYVLEKEKEWPIQSWRVGNRTDTSGRSDILYWVKRGNGYSRDGYEEEVHFTIVNSDDGWQLESFSAVY
jgi:hypothetical protein